MVMVTNVEDTVNELLREASSVQNPAVKLRLFIQLDYYFLKNTTLQPDRYPLYEKVQQELREYYTQN